MFRRAGVNLLKKVLDGRRWIDAFPVGTVVSPVLMTDDHYFTGVVIEVQPKINKVFVSWDGGSQPTQHDPDELEPIYPCTSPSGVSHTKTASVITASKKPEDKDVFTVDMWNETEEYSLESDPVVTKIYYDVDEAIDAAEGLLNDYMDEEDEWVVSVFAGEYEKPNGAIWGEPTDIWSKSNKSGKKTASVRMAYSGLLSEAIKICKDNGIHIGKPGYGTSRNEVLIKDKDQKEARRILKENGIIADFAPGVGHDYNYGGDLFNLKRADEGVKTASVKNASMSDYEYQCACAIRKALVDEHDAVAVYEEMAQFAQDDDMKTIAESIAAEEKVHIGELTALLNRYNGNELETMAEGVAENDEQLNPTTTPAVEIGADIPFGHLAPVPEDVVVVGIDAPIEEAPVESVVDAVPVDTLVEAIPVEAIVDEVPVETPVETIVKSEPPPIIQLLASDKARIASKYKDCKICEFGKIIRDNYAKMPMEAEIFVDYFDGMDDLETRIGNYDGVDVVKGFLANSADWTSQTGKAVKAELLRRVKEFEKDIPKPLLDAEKKEKK